MYFITQKIKKMLIKNIIKISKFHHIVLLIKLISFLLQKIIILKVLIIFKYI